MNASGRRAALAALAVVVYATMWVGWELNWSWLVTADTTTLDAAHRVGVEHHAWVTFWNALCTVFSPAVIRLLALGLIAYELVRRRPRIALFLFAGIELSGLLTQGAKFLADRPRPDTAAVYASSTSFPSGHALGTMVAVLVLAAVYLPAQGRAIRVAATVAGTLVVVGVGVGRVALNVHHLSDVVAGWALGYLYFTICLWVLRPPPLMATAETPEAPGTER